MQRDLTPHAPFARFHRVGRGAIAAAAAIALVAGVGLVTTSAAQADTVPYAVDFSPPVVPMGGVSRSYLDCDADAGAVASVSALAPDATTRTSSPVVGATGNSPERLILDAGPGELIDTDEPGTWTVTVDCPSYDPYETTLEVLVPTLTAIARLDGDYDCTTTDDYFGVGTRGSVCLTVTNTTGQDIARIGWISPTSGGFEYPAPGEFPAGATRTGVINLPSALPVGGGTIEGLQVWVEVGTPYAGDFRTSDLVSVETPLLPAPLELQVTTGLDAATACDDDGGLDHRDLGVPEVELYVCYHVGNTSGVDFEVQGLHDSVLGTLFTGKAVQIVSQGSYEWVTPGPVHITDDTVFTATWSAEPDDYYSSLPEDFVATATGSATVLVSEPVTTTTVPTPSPTGTNGPVDTTTVGTTYVVAQATPAFTG